MTSFTLNGKSVSVDDDPSTPLLWVIRDSLGLTGTKFGCGMALCGACTVHLDGIAIRSCVAPLSRVAGKHVTTIEGLSSDNSHPVQRAWIESDVRQHLSLRNISTHSPCHPSCRGNFRRGRAFA